jgi:hypothetical protein
VRPAFHILDRVDDTGQTDSLDPAIGVTMHAGLMENPQPEHRATFGGLALLPHDHLCALYRGVSERYRLMLDFISAGLDESEQCLCIGSGRDISQLTSMLSRHQFDCALLQAVELEDACPPSDAFEPETVTDAMHRWSATAFDENGCDSARAIVDMTWTASDTSTTLIDGLARFEVGVTQLAGRRSQICVSMYDLNAFGGAIVPAMVTSHVKVWMCGAIVENPYATPTITYRK